MKESYHRLFTKIKLYFSPLQVNHTAIKYFLNVFNKNSYSKEGVFTVIVSLEGKNQRLKDSRSQQSRDWLVKKYTSAYFELQFLNVRSLCRNFLNKTELFPADRTEV